jgi:hypothetical protein
MKNVLRLALDECVSPTNIVVRNSLYFQELHKGILGCDKTIKGIYQFHVKMRNDGCAWLHGGVVFVSKFDYFLQQKLVIIVL